MTGGPSDRYVELLNYEMEVANVLQAKEDNLSDKEKVPIIKNWLGRERLQFIQTLTNVEKEACKITTGQFNAKKIRPQHNEMILSLQYCKFHKEENESMQEWMVDG